MNSVSCASSISGGTTKLSVTNREENRSKSCDTNCTSNASCFFKKRKPMNPLAYPMRPAYHKINNNPVKQRVMSAKLLKLRQLQSQLNDANYHLVEVARENQILKTLQKRQDKALSKYENTNADLPRLIHSHEEEIRVLTEKNRNLRKSVKELTEQLKQKDEELTKTREQLFHLERLNKDKYLTEREKLTDKMEDFKIKLQKSEEQITILNRKLMLESKTSKQRLNVEIAKHKQCQRELLQAFDEIDRLTGLIDVKENMVRPRNARLTKSQNNSSVSTTSLRNYYAHNKNLSNEKLTPQNPVTEVKLEPIVNGKESDSSSSKSPNRFKTPMENIRQRLSSGSTKEASSTSEPSSAGSFKSRPNSSLKLEKLPMVQENQKIRTKMKTEVKSDDDSDEHEFLGEKEVTVKYDYEKPVMSNSVKVNNNRINKVDEVAINERVESEDEASDEHEDSMSVLGNMKNIKQQKENSLNLSKVEGDCSDPEKDIERMAENLDAAIQRASDKSKEKFDKELSNYCSDVLNSVKSCGKVIEAHKNSLQISIGDTETLMDTFKSTEKIESKLKKSFFNFDDDDMDFVKEILNEEHKFQVENKARNLTRDKNSNIERKSLVNLESKKKLLATLRAIDNGDSVESVEEPNQVNIVKEIFGNIAH